MRRPTIRAIGNRRTLAAHHPNAGTGAAYARRLTALVDAMHKSVTYWLLAQYRATPPLAQDAARPARDLADEMRDLGARWESRFDEAGPKVAAWFATAVKDRSDASLAATLKAAGMTVKFTMTPVVRDIFAATLNEQVGLIKSIARQHLQAVAGAVNRSVQTGRDIGGLAKELEETHGVTRRRAQVIAQHQNAVATATITKARQGELGIVEAVWLHSGGGRHPRKTHVAMSGKTYRIADGWKDPATGNVIWPGTEINCRCVPKSVIPGLE